MTGALAAVAAIGAALTVAACGGGGGSSSSSGGGASSSSSATSDRAVKYSECMREHGVTNFPDPKNGRLVMRSGQGGVDPNSQTFKSAAQACRSLAPSGARTSGGSNQALEARVLELARCMRRNGVPNFPDPKVQGGGVRFQLPAGVDPNSATFKAAQAKCGSLVSGGGAP